MEDAIRINSLEEYINIINKKILECKKSNIKISSKTYRLFFRGQSNLKWELQPSIMRSKETEKTKIDKYYKEYGNISLFHNLSLIQHKESGTRFLDFTMNPLIALYFACNGNYEIDGKVYTLFFDGLNSNWKKSKILYHISFLSKDKKEITLWNYKKYLVENINGFSDCNIDLNVDIIDAVFYGNLVIPLKDDYKVNKRLSRQCGVFYICPPKILHIGEKEVSHIKDRYLLLSDNDVTFSTNKVEVPKWLYNGSIEEIIISSSAKCKIIDELNKKYGINEQYLFPNI